MIGLLMVAAISAQDAPQDPALVLCKPVLARKAGGQIATLDVTSARTNRSGRTIEGRLTAFVGMGPPATGSASTHHLIRTDFDFRCRVRGDRVREARLNLFKP